MNRKNRKGHTKRKDERGFKHHTLLVSDALPETKANLWTGSTLE